MDPWNAFKIASLRAFATLGSKESLTMTICKKLLDPYSRALAASGTRMTHEPTVKSEWFFGVCPTP